MNNQTPPRRVLPRWRDSSVALPLVDARPVPAAAGAAQNWSDANWGEEAERRVDEWKQDRQVGLAADALSFGVLPGTDLALRPVAEFVLASPERFPTPTISLARLVLGVLPPTQREAEPVDAIRLLRARLRDNCANPIALVDFARHQTTLGHNPAAHRAFRIALALAPQDRFVSRSAARFFVHSGDPELAAQALRKSGRAKTDPWILASEIAVMSVMGRTSSNLSLARQMLKSQALPPEHLSELASAVGTVEMFSGKLREAKRLFNLALLRPNDNTIAQAQWVSTILGRRFDPEPDWITNPHSMEARCLRAFDEGTLELAVRHAGDWFKDEPFSSRPMVLASFANSVLGRNDAAEAAAQEGLRANADDVVLMNNRVFALASGSRFNEAESLLQQVIQLEHDTPSPQTVANVGLLLMRSGDIERGVGLYRVAAERLDKASNPSGKMLALAFLARELRVAGVESWIQVRNECQQLLAKTPSTPVQLVLESLDADPNPIQSQARNWRIGGWSFDAATNTLILPRGGIR